MSDIDTIIEQNRTLIEQNTIIVDKLEIIAAGIWATLGVVTSGIIYLFIQIA